MISRNLQAILEDRLRQFPAVALLGPRQVGKTTLARVTAGTADSLYLDLENPSDLEKLADARGFLGAQRGRLIVLDEVQRLPGLFQVLRARSFKPKHVPSDHGYRYLIHDRDSIFSAELDGCVANLRLAVLKTPYRVPPANACCERLIGSMRRDCLDFVIPLVHQIWLTLKTQGISDSWETIRTTLGTQMRTTASVRGEHGEQIHIRKSNYPNASQEILLRALELPWNPGKTQKTVVTP